MYVCKYSKHSNKFCLETFFVRRFMQPGQLVIFLKVRVCVSIEKRIGEDAALLNWSYSNII